MRRYGVREGGNVEYDPHGEFTGKNILYLADETVGRYAADQQACAILLEARGKRPRPPDDKILTAWNGLMIPGLLWRGLRVAGTALRRGRTARCRVPHRPCTWMESCFADTVRVMPQFQRFVTITRCLQALLIPYEVFWSDPRHLQLAIDLSLCKCASVSKTPSTADFSALPCRMMKVW